MKPTFELLPTIEPKPQEKIEAKREHLADRMKYMSEKGWVIKLNYAVQTGWICEINWHNSLCDARGSAFPKYEQGKPPKLFTDPFDAFETALSIWFPKYEKWSQENAGKAKESPKPTLSLVKTKPAPKPKRRRKKLTTV